MLVACYTPWLTHFIDVEPLDPVNFIYFTQTWSPASYLPFHTIPPGPMPNHAVTRRAVLPHRGRSAWRAHSWDKHPTDYRERHTIGAFNIPHAPTRSARTHYPSPLASPFRAPTCHAVPTQQSNFDVLSTSLRPRPTQRKYCLPRIPGPPTGASPFVFPPPRGEISRGRGS